MFACGRLRVCATVEWTKKQWRQKQQQWYEVTDSQEDGEAGGRLALPHPLLPL